MQYAVGQAVYTNVNIQEWFICSPIGYIPAKTMGYVTKIDQESPPRYYVFFGRKFGEIIIPEKYLELG